ncbi:hypothetical protein ACFTXJ_07690 [Streptomyces zhihengii]|uniref:hypothetical protein n=1 Tax=Streptomyces zhihengii TaxID=1818004 RepID=UPI0036443FB6
MPFEDEIGDALRRTGETMTPADRLRLVEGGTARGRRKLAVRRATVAGSVLALAVVGVGGGHAAGLLGGGADRADGRAAVAAEGGTRQSGPTSPPAGAEGAVTAEQMLRTLTDLLPAGDLAGKDGRGSAKEGSSAPYASVVFDDGGGAARISLSLGRIDPGGESAASMVTCPSKALVDFDECRQETLSDGSRYLFVQGYVHDRDRGAKQWRSTLLTPAGVLIDASEYNAPEEKGAAVTRADPPLTPARMKSLVTADEWDPIAAAYQAEAGAPPEAGAGGPGGPSGEKTVAALTGLLPSGLEVTDRGGEPGYAYVVVDDGKGASFVQINVQPGMSDLAGDFAGGTTLPDGTLLRETQDGDPDQKGGTGSVGWTVDTLRPDGLRVVIMAFNAPAQGQNASRAEPALTMAQLKGIVLDPVWTGLG